MSPIHDQAPFVHGYLTLHEGGQDLRIRYLRVSTTSELAQRSGKAQQLLRFDLRREGALWVTRHSPEQ